MIQKENYLELLSELQEKKVRLVAVSKNQPNEKILELYRLGQRDFGENKAQELFSKQAVLPTDIRWHFIGHLQTNKVKLVVPYVSLIHAVDSLRLLKEINKEAEKHNKVVDYLLQVYIAKEETKFGLDEQEVFELIGSPEFPDLKNVNIRGLMGMATFTENTNQVEGEFSYLRNLYQKLKEQYFKDKKDFSELSMGMSDDYRLAIQEGSTMVRIGTYIFGERI
jgi:pyridoxal phosphate enzyme (YggS family)